MKYCKVCNLELTKGINWPTDSLLCRVHLNEEVKRKYYTYYRVRRLEANANYAKKNNQTTHRKKQLNTINKRMYKKYLDKAKARGKLHYAIKKGYVQKPTTCQNSSKGIACFGQIQAHHYIGYEGEHWRDVMWLCKKHHELNHLVTL